MHFSPLRRSYLVADAFAGHPDRSNGVCLQEPGMVDRTGHSAALVMSTRGGHAGLQLAAAPEDSFPEIDGASPGVDQLKAHMRLVARDAVITVLILGESGTGKERVARAIHRASRRREAPFVIVNCAGLAPTLVEDELFGHVRGAFTGAIDERAGPFERAHGGIVFLDEIGELTLELQAKLLRALQERTVQRLGSRKETTFDAQIVAATNVDLTRAVARGRLREDLYYRLKVYELAVPSLRSRGPADLRMLVEAILTRLAGQRRQPRPAIDPALLERLERHSWPGNVRELENTLERMVVAAGGSSLLTMGHLPSGFGTSIRRRLDASADGLALPYPPAPTPTDIRVTLASNGGRLGQTASDVGLSRHQLYRRLKIEVQRGE